MAAVVGAGRGPELKSSHSSTVRRVAAGLIVLGSVGLVIGIVGLVAFGKDESSPAASPSLVATVVPSPGTSPVPRSPTASPSPAPPSTTDPTPETPEQFYADLAEAIRTGDAAYLFDRLHGAVLARYGADQCRAYTDGIEDPSFEIEVFRVYEPAAWTWELDGLSTTLPEAIAVDIVIRTEAEETAQEAHLAFDAGELKWFTDCGEPT